MNITIEDNKVIVNMDAEEFPEFQAMFANLKLDKFGFEHLRTFDFNVYKNKTKRESLSARAYIVKNN